MTDTPDKEWIWVQKAMHIVLVHCAQVPAHTFDRSRLVDDIARELQSSFDQGVERERERLRADLRWISDNSTWDSPVNLRARRALGDDGLSQRVAAVDGA